VISLIGRGESKENIAYGVVASIAEKVASQCSRLALKGKRIYLTGGLCDCSYIREILSDKLKMQVDTQPNSRYAGAIGAAITATKLK
ncbi:MAG: CoA activase, partial [Lachnospiraceae bacterium]|nr:CoA activase [Lachnospiraceae bacterium]